MFVQLNLHLLCFCFTKTTSLHIILPSYILNILNVRNTNIYIYIGDLPFGLIANVCSMYARIYHALSGFNISFYGSMSVILGGSVLGVLMFFLVFNLFPPVF